MTEAPDGDFTKFTLETEHLEIDSLENFVKTFHNNYNINKVIPEKVILRWVTEMCKVLAVLHGKRVFLKNFLHEFNVFMNQKIVKICDYELHDIYDVTLGKKTEFQPVAKTERSSFLDIKYDMFRMGLLLLKLMTCSKVDKFNTKHFGVDSNPQEIVKMIERIPKVYGKPLNMLVRKLLSTNPAQRPDSTQVLQQNLISVHKRISVVTPENANIIVSPTFFSWTKTIKQALAIADVNDVILVEEGTYYGDLEIVMPVNLHARGTVVIMGNIYIRANCKITGFSIRGNQESTPAIEIDKGFVTISNCDIQSKGDGICVRGQASSPVVKNCHIFSCDGNGITISFKSSGVYFKNDIYDNKRNGIFVSDSDPSIKQNRIYCNVNGIQTKGECGKIKSNDIFQNSSYGILIKRTSKLLIRENYIRSNMCGIGVSEDGKGKVFHNMIFENKFHGIIIDHSEVILEENHCYSNRECGIAIVNTGKSTLIKNLVYFNNNNGIFVSEQATPVIYDNVIHSNMGTGITITKSATANIRKNEIYSNQNQAIATSSTQKSMIKENKLYDSKGSSILVYDGGLCAIIENEIEGSYKNGVEIRKKGNVELTGNKINSSGGCGVSISDLSLIVMKDNHITESGFDNVNVTKNSTCRFLTGNQFKGANCRGINLYDGSKIQGDLKKVISTENGLEDRLDIVGMVTQVIEL